MDKTDISVVGMAQRYMQLVGHTGSLDVSEIELKAELIEEGNSVKNLDTIHEPHEVHIENGRVGPIKSTQTLPNRSYIKWTSGIDPDWEDKITFKSPVGPGEVSVRIDHMDYQVIENGSVEVELHSFCGNARNAKASTSRREGAVSFQVRVYPSKHFLAWHNGPFGDIKMQTAIAELKRRDPGSVSQLHTEGSKYYWVMEGICKISSTTRHAHEWSN